MAPWSRESGILLHPTCLPGPFGIGDVGPTAHAFVDLLVELDQRVWQMLPLTPTSAGDSPYFSPSAFAANPLLIAPGPLAEAGYLEARDLADLPDFPAERVAFDRVVPFKRGLWERAAAAFAARASHADRDRFEAFVATEAAWLDDFALFMALKEAHQGAVWTSWPSDLAQRDPDALARARRELAEPIRYHQLLQHWFDTQWQALRGHAHAAGIDLVGDLPIFVAHDSADVWAHPELWQLDPQGQPRAVAGVPPDYFSATGQLWGNPLYDWERMAEDGYAWWAARCRALLRRVDRIRLDHFRGFAAYWAVSAGALTAEHGRWVPGPGRAFFAAMQRQLGRLPLLAEDLGVITPDVVELREHFGLPGMKILQFAFDSGEENDYFPHRYGANCIVYPGTHDNDTAAGWYQHAKRADRELMAEYVGKSTLLEPHWELIRLGHASVANSSLVALQDLLGLGSEARMNLPGTASGNWAWRWDGSLPEAIGARFRRMTRLYDRGRA